MDKLRRFGLQNAIVHPFTKEFSRLSALEFVRDYLVNKLHVKKLVIGYDHQFGKNREGSIQFLREISDTYGFEVIEIPAEEINDVNVSSTKVRSAIADGELELVQHYLGEPFELHGRVVDGQALGRQIGFPTANIDIESDVKLLPKSGVYAVNVLLGEGTLHEGMMNIGMKPTVGLDDSVTVEVHLFDFNRDIYGQFVTVQLLSRFRDEQKFESVYDLREQLRKDEDDIRAYFTTHS